MDDGRWTSPLTLKALIQRERLCASLPRTRQTILPSPRLMASATTTYPAACAGLQGAEMKAIGEKYQVTAANGLGHDSTATHQKFEITEADVGHTRDNYLGYRHKYYKFTRADIGREIIVMTDGTGWTCWSFGARNV